MVWQGISKALGVYFLFFAFILCFPFIVSYYYDYTISPSLHPQPDSTFAFLWTILICLMLGILSFMIGQKAELNLRPKENIIILLLIYLISPAIAALPFLFSNTLDNPVQAYFESMSGFTTTGATVLHPKSYDLSGKEVPIQKEYGQAVKIDYQFYGTVTPIRDSVTNQIVYEGIEAVSKGILFWRSLLQWIGGFAILVLFIAILPPLGVGGVSSKLLFRMEMSHPTESFLYRVVHTAIQLFLIYLGLTIIQIGLLLYTNDNMGVFDAVTLSLTTLSTGGFSIHNANIAFYNNANTEWVIMAFMIVGSTNFIIFYYMLKKQFFRVFHIELFAYLLLIILGASIVSWFLAGTTQMPLNGSLNGSNYSSEEAIRYGFFQMISSISSTGFRTADYDKWPLTIQTLMIIGIFIGGMSYSTAGGMKVMRQVISFREAQARTETLFKPGGTRLLRIGGQEISADSILMILTFFWLAICIFAIGNFFYLLDHIDIQTAFSLTVSMLNNSAIGFRMAGPTESCAFLSNFSLILSSLLMLLGRLEYFIILAVLTPAFWKET